MDNRARTLSGRNPPQEAALDAFWALEEKGDKREQLDFLKYWRLILKRKWLIILIVLIAGTVTGVKSLSKEPVYRATATLLIEPSLSTQVTPIQNRMEPRGYYQNLQYFNTQKAVITSRSFAERIVDSLELWNNTAFLNAQTGESRAPLKIEWREFLEEWFPQLAGSAQPPQPQSLDADQARNRAIGVVQSGLSVEQVEDSQLLKVSFRSNDAVFAAEVANMIADIYIKLDLESRLQNFKKATDWLTERTASLRSNLLESELELQKSKENLDVIDVGGKSTVEQELDSTFQNLAEAEKHRMELETLFKDLGDLKSRPIERVVTHPAILRNESVKQAYASFLEAKQKVDSLALRYGSKHPKMIEARNGMKVARRLLQDEVTLVLSKADQDLQLARRKEENLQRRFEDLTSENQKQSRSLFELHNLEKDAEANRELYDLFVTRFKETNVASDLDTPNARIIDPAQIPTRPVWPTPQKDVFKAIMMALAGGVILALFLEFMDNTIRTPEDLEEKIGLTHLASLPLLKGKDGDSVETFFLSNPNSSFSEFIRTLRTGVLLSGLDNPHRIVLVTSTVPAEGKTTVAINLALGLAQVERVLLIDADMRRASMGEQFGFGPETPGLSNVVAGTAEAEECLYRFEEGNLDLLPVGLVPPNPQELMSSQRFAELVTGLSEKYDRVVIDTAPTHAVSDALLISTLASAIIYVIKADATPVQLINTSLKRYRQTEAPLVGAVLNQVNFAKARHYGYHYGKYDKSYYSKSYQQYYGKA